MEGRGQQGLHAGAGGSQYPAHVGQWAHAAYVLKGGRAQVPSSDCAASSGWQRGMELSAADARQDCLIQDGRHSPPDPLQPLYVGGVVRRLYRLSYLPPRGGSIPSDLASP